jgi:putative DNA primase/helicase
MNLPEAISAAGMRPPLSLCPGRWLRFPGAGKNRSNRSGWCKVISPTLAYFGDWSTGLSQVWIDESHIDNEASRKALRDAQERERRYARELERNQAAVARDAARIASEATLQTHPYLVRKGFADLLGMVCDGRLVVPVSDLEQYPRPISLQFISADGEKKFMPGGRTKLGVYRLGVHHSKARRVTLCEGYATALSIQAALRMLPGAHCVYACFSALNMERVSDALGSKCDALVCADNDPLKGLPGKEHKAGEEAAKRTGRRWVMPAEVGQDWNDVHVNHGLRAVMEAIRSA